MDWLALGTAIIGMALGSIITIVIVKSKWITSKENPRLKIAKFRGFNETNGEEKDTSSINILALVVEKFQDGSKPQFTYDERALNYNNLCFIEYTLKNEGITKINTLYFTSNYKSISIFGIDDISHIMIEEKMLNYDMDANNLNMELGDTIKIRVYYIKNKIAGTNLKRPVFAIWIKDINNKIWVQSLYSPENKISNPKKSTSRKLRECIDTDVAIEYFRNLP